jgi:hypothetical protein
VTGGGKGGKKLPDIGCGMGFVSAVSPAVFLAYWVYREWWRGVGSENVREAQNMMHGTPGGGEYFEGGWNQENKNNDESRMQESKSKLFFLFSKIGSV